MKELVSANEVMGEIGEPQSIHLAPDYVIIALRLTVRPELSAASSS